MYRQVWHCDCDGESHLSSGHEKTGPGEMVRKMAEHIGAVTGHEPPTCPWRVFYDPLVREVLKVLRLSGRNLSQCALPADPPGILLDAIGVYETARGATEADERERERQDRDAKRRLAQNAQNAKRNSRG